MSEEIVSVNIDCVEFDSGTVSLRSLGVGLEPFILIEPDEDGDENLVFNIISSGMNNEELKEVFDLINHIIQNGQEK